MSHSSEKIVPSQRTGVDEDAIRALVEGRSHDPFGILGPHPVESDGETRLSIRVFVPSAKRVWIFPTSDPKGVEELKRRHDAGFFEATIGPVGTDFRYRLRVEDESGHAWDGEDAFRFGRVLTDFDLHLLGEGEHHRSFDKLGAHTIELDGVSGVHFAVWAPNAERVSVVGEFNQWDGRRHPMRALGASGIWEIFVPEIGEGQLYKFEIRSRVGERVFLKSDPYAFGSQLRPETASVVRDTDHFQWTDDEWMGETRARRQALDAPISIYEVHLGSWQRGEDGRYLTYAELAEGLIPYVKEMGFTHIELLPIQEHPFDGSWGYQPLGYFAPTSRFGTPAEFAAFVDACHRAEIGVLLDWVPAHFPRDDHGLRQFDGTCLYEHEDPRQGEHRDWGTLIFNYGRNEVRNFLIGNALFWLEKYHLDGIRVDAVASMLYLDYSREEDDWIPNEHGGRENLAAIDFLRRFNEICHREHPGVLTIAEESTAWTGVSRPTYVGGLGFSLKWNMGWMNDILYYFSRDPVYRKWHHNNLTFGMLYAYTENFLLPLSHDEVVHGKCSLLDKMPGDAWQKFSNLRALYGFQYAFPGKKLLFMGSEFGQGREWTCDQALDWHLLETGWHRGVQQFLRDLNRVYCEEPALHAIDFEWDGFEWLDFRDWEKSVIAFVRKGRRPEDEVVVVLNFTPEFWRDYRLGVPTPGFYRELINSDSEHYGGSNQGNSGGVHSEDVPSHERPQSLSLNIPPLSALMLKRAKS